MGELASRPKLQTMYSIAVANPFSPRPDGIYGDLPLSKLPPLPLDYDWNCSNAEFDNMCYDQQMLLCPNCSNIDLYKYTFSEEYLIYL